LDGAEFRASLAAGREFAGGRGHLVGGVDYLKIDGMFVTGMLENEVDQAMVHAFNWIGHVHGLKTIAEHVENPAMLAKLHTIGVDYVQGFGIAAPGRLDSALIGDTADAP
jgi:EAL domain-containing protein (putative c-di-GMP-specific phosphodiesterase class I)